MFTQTSNAYQNYLSKVVRINKLRPHTNADRLQIAVVEFQNVIVGLDVKEGDYMIYVPIECQINESFLSYTNSYRDSSKNRDTESTGFFDDKGRVKPVRLRGEKSEGYLIPFATLREWYLTNHDEPYFESPEEVVGTLFDKIGDAIFVNKYVSLNKRQGSGKTAKNDQKALYSRVLENTFAEHVSTTNLQRGITDLTPDTIISVSEKLHGTSARYAKTYVKRKPTFWDKVIRIFNKSHQPVEEDLLYGSRRVIKNNRYSNPKDGAYYSTNVWERVMGREGLENIPLGYTVYGEITGYEETGKGIQGNFDYGDTPGSCSFWVYRVTFGIPGQQTLELTYPQRKAFCEKLGLMMPPLHYYGKARHMYPDLNPDLHWHGDFLKRLEDEFLEMDCPMCTNKVPREGIVINPEYAYEARPLKLKSFRFKQMESKGRDKELTQNITEDN